MKKRDMGAILCMRKREAGPVRVYVYVDWGDNMIWLCMHFEYNMDIWVPCD